MRRMSPLAAGEGKGDTSRGPCGWGERRRSLAIIPRGTELVHSGGADKKNKETAVGTDKLVVRLESGGMHTR